MAANQLEQACVSTIFVERVSASRGHVVRHASEREQPDEDVARDSAWPDEEKEHLGAEQREVELVKVRFWVRVVSSAV